MDKIENGGNQVCADINNVSANGTSNKHFNSFNMKKQNNTKDVYEYKDLLKGLNSLYEVDVLTTIYLLFNHFADIENKSKNTYTVTCDKYSDLIYLALNYLKGNKKQFEETRQYIVSIEEIDDNVFEVITE